MRTRGRDVALLCCLILFAGCTVRLVDFTVISTKNVRVPSKSRAERVAGDSCNFILLFVPLGVPNMKEAIDRAVEKAGPDFDALVDGVVYQTGWWFVVGQSCIKVEGTPINTKAISMKEREKKNLMLHSNRLHPHPSELKTPLPVQ